MKKIALVTGGSRGIGAEICRFLADDGYFVYVNYIYSQENAEEAADLVGGKCIKFDVANAEQVKTAIAQIGRIDLLVNNAGVSEIGLFTHIMQERADEILNINLRGVLNCSRAVLPKMIEQKSGGIINISSVWGQCGASCEVDYSASKAGIIGFTKALSQEVAPSGIRVNCVSPGFIMTEMNRQFSHKELETIREDIPLGRFGTVRDVAETVAFLASERASYITGQVIAVNGGVI